MKPLLRLKPYLLRYKKTLLWGVVTVIASNIFTVVQPWFLGQAVDDLERSIDTNTLFLGSPRSRGSSHS
jgi:ATP-binding cassette subfamily B multidrug efflux pump